MPLQWQTTPIAFQKGLNTRTNQKLVVPGKWLQLNNLTFGKDDSPQLRPGIAPLVSANGNGLATHNNKLCIINGKTLSTAAIGSTQAPSNAAVGQVSNIALSAAPVTRGQFYVDSLDMATAGKAGLTAYVWRNTSATAVTAFAAIVDEATGAFVLPPTQLAITGRFPRVVFAGAAFFFFGCTGGGATIQCQVVQGISPTVVGPLTTLVALASATLPIDAIAFGTNSAMLMSVDVVGGVTATRVRQITQTAGVPAVAATTVIATNAAVPVANITALTCASFSAGLAGAFIMASGGTGVVGATVNGSFAIVTALTTIDNATVVVAGAFSHLTAVGTANGFSLFYDQMAAYNTLAVNPLVTSTCSSTLAGIATKTLVFSATFLDTNYYATPPTGPYGPQGPFIAGKAFVCGTARTQTMLPVMVAETSAGGTATAASPSLINAQNTGFVLDGITGLVQARMLYGVFGNVPPFSGTSDPPFVAPPCSTPGLGNDTFALAVPQAGNLAMVNGVDQTFTGVTRVQMVVEQGADSVVAYSSGPVAAQLGQTTYLAGGVLKQFDGQTAGDPGFQLFPEGVTGHNSAGADGGAGLTAGVHQVVAVYEFTDAQGNRFQSAASPPISLTADGSGADIFTLFVPDLQLPPQWPASSPALSTCNIVLYMTTAGQATFYRTQGRTFATGYTPNSPGQTHSVITIGTLNEVDTLLSANEPLYMQPAISGYTLPNQLPGPCTALCTHQQRLFFNQTDNPLGYGFSQPYQPGVGLQFNQALGGVVPASSGGIVAFSPMDDKVVIHCVNGPFIVYGTGPRVDGTFSNYSDPQPVPTETGCSDSRSILAMPNGIIFKSTLGWYLLGRDLSVTYIGEGVAAFDSNKVLGAMLMQDRQEAWFSTVDALGLQNEVLAFNYRLGEWSTMTAGYTMHSLLWWPVINQAVHVSRSQRVNTSVPGQLFDQIGAGAQTGIGWTAQTAYLNMGLLEGFQRARWLYVTMSAGTAPGSNMLLGVAYDDNGFNYTVSFGAGALGVANGVVDYRHKLRIQKCKSFSILLTDDGGDPGNNQFGITGLQAIAIEWGRKKGPNRLPASQTVG